MANPNPSVATRVSNGENLCDPLDKLCPLAQVKRMQRVLFRDVIDETTDKRLRPQIACAWERLEQRKAVLNGKPGSLTAKVDLDKPKRGQRRSFAQASKAPVPTDAGPQTPAPTPSCPTQPVSVSPTPGK